MATDIAEPVVIRAKLKRWHNRNARAFPWRETRDPYHILVAALLLRKTRARDCVGPYEDLLRAYPTVRLLAAASVKDVEQLFRPIGLTSRAQALTDIARTIVHRHAGVVPDEESALIALPGVGRYAASSVLSLAFDKPYPMVDESVGRLLRRILGWPRQRPAYADRRLRAAANGLLLSKGSRDVNLALIDLSAAICTTTKPACYSCPLSSNCRSAHSFAPETSHAAGAQ